MDADSIGGRVEFNTKKPSDLKETLFKVKLASKFGEYSSNNAPNLSMNYGAPINDTYAISLASLIRVNILLLIMKPDMDGRWAHE